MTQHIAQDQIEAIHTRYGGDMVNCANAIARQAVANYIDQQSKEDLLVLPDPVMRERGPFPDAWVHYHTADQLQAYGADCAAHAREMALSEAAKEATDMGMHVCALAIEALKGKG